MSPNYLGEKQVIKGGRKAVENLSNVIFYLIVLKVK